MALRQVAPNVFELVGEGPVEEVYTGTGGDENAASEDSNFKIPSTLSAVERYARRRLQKDYREVMLNPLPTVAAKPSKKVPLPVLTAAFVTANSNFMKILKFFQIFSLYIYSHILECASSKEIWGRVNRAHQKISVFGITFLQEEIFVLRAPHWPKIQTTAKNDSNPDLLFGIFVSATCANE